MRTGGFPCRYGGCDACFFVAKQGSVESLMAASAERTAHEISAHDYHHVRLDEVLKQPAWTARSTPKR
ncbi:MAG: hypothetical protein ACRDGE_09340 [Candidatus Limnocylindria bacterium]